MTAAHQLRIISADKFERLDVIKNLPIPQPQQRKNGVTLPDGNKLEFGQSSKALSDLFERATYGAFLGAFVQGLEVGKLFLCS